MLLLLEFLVVLFLEREQAPLVLFLFVESLFVEAVLVRVVESLDLPDAVLEVLVESLALFLELFFEGVDLRFELGLLLLVPAFHLFEHFQPDLLALLRVLADPLSLRLRGLQLGLQLLQLRAQVLLLQFLLELRLRLGLL